MAEFHEDPIGRKGSATGAMQQRETVGEKVREGWNDFKTNVKRKWNELTDKDIDTYQSKDRSEFVGYVHDRVGGDRTLVERDVDDIARRSNYRWP